MTAIGLALVATLFGSAAGAADAEENLRCGYGLVANGAVFEAQRLLKVGRPNEHVVYEVPHVEPISCGLVVVEVSTEEFSRLGDGLKRTFRMKMQRDPSADVGDRGEWSYVGPATD